MDGGTVVLSNSMRVLGMSSRNIDCEIKFYVKLPEVAALLGAKIFELPTAKI